MQMIAQDKPLRKVAWKLLASDVVGVKLTVKDAFKNEHALFASNERNKVTGLRKTLDQTVTEGVSPTCRQPPKKIPT